MLMLKPRRSTTAQTRSRSHTIATEWLLLALGSLLFKFCFNAKMTWKRSSQSAAIKEQSIRHMEMKVS